MSQLMVAMTFNFALLHEGGNFHKNISCNIIVE